MTPGESVAAAGHVVSATGSGATGRRLHKVLVVHNAYRHRGGEDSVVDSELALLRGKGHQVVEYIRHNHEIDGASSMPLAAQSLWSHQTTSEVAAVLARELPDVVHVHNTLPLVSPSVYWACARAGVPVVQTLHNFRLACPQAIFLRKGKVCESCLGRVPWRAVAHGCYRGSRAQSAVVAATSTLHWMLGTWSRKVSRYIALNEFCRDKFIAAGLPPDRVAIKPNFVDEPGAVEKQARKDFLYVGRLSVEKGVSVLLEAARLDDHEEIRIAGSGPQARQVSATTEVKALGVLDPGGVNLELARALAMVIPSICYESHPRTLVEAFACGTPVIASRLGAMPALVTEGVTGLLFNPGDAQDLARVMRWASEHPREMAAMGARARDVYESKYSPAENYRQLIEIYDAACCP
jgi:glycosyltransferase involved in cell wall biosynthesis